MSNTKDIHISGVAASTPSLSASRIRTKGLYWGEESQGECVKPFARTRIPDNSSSVSRDRPEVGFHLVYTNTCAEE